MNKEELCGKIKEIYTEIGECGIDLEVNWDKRQKRWVVGLRKDAKQLETYLEPGDAELCMMGKQCVGLGIEINQLKDSIERMPA